MVIKGQYHIVLSSPPLTEHPYIYIYIWCLYTHYLYIRNICVKWPLGREEVALVSNGRGFIVSLLNKPSFCRGNAKHLHVGAIRERGAIDPSSGCGTVEEALAMFLLLTSGHRGVHV